MYPFPVGFHALHGDVSLNFQMNRWWSWVGEPQMLEEMRRIAPRLDTYGDWKREFTALARGAEAGARPLAAAYYWRSAEFFMAARDPDRAAARARFLDLLRDALPLSGSTRHRVPFPHEGRSRWMSAIDVRPEGEPLDTVVFFGGFDSYIEELTPALGYLRAAGLRVIAFEGPGQGTTLHEAGLRMTPNWHLPVAAVLDHFALAECALLGLSLGGCLAIRAAAREPRVRRVVAYDILTDFFEVSLRQTHALAAGVLRRLIRLRLSAIVNASVGVVAARSPVVGWGIAQGMEVTGTADADAFLRQVLRYRTDDVSAQLDQDVLLLAGADDHFVPVHQLAAQARALTRARSVTTRLFTRAESASSHCQAGNYRLAYDTIIGWLEATRLGTAPARLTTTV